jgi:hypothetical protein
VRQFGRQPLRGLQSHAALMLQKLQVISTGSDVIQVEDNDTSKL